MSDPRRRVCKVIEVIVCTYEAGDGVDPKRVIGEIWTKEGRLVLRQDPEAQATPTDMKVLQ